jgi:ParB-like chromosome segregation protein Spo0J
MSAIDEANAIKTMVVDYGLKQKDIAGILSKSKGWVSQRMALTTLDPLVQAALAEGKIGHAHARELIKVQSKEAQRDILAEALTSDWQVEDWKRAAAKARRAENKEEQEEEKEEEPTDEKPTPPRYAVKRSPKEINSRQEELEWEEDEIAETPYKRGARNALRWVLGLADSLDDE